MKISAVVHPGSKKPRIEERQGEKFHIYVSERAFNGLANDSVIRALAAYFGVSITSIQILKGLKSKHKIIAIG